MTEPAFAITEFIVGQASGFALGLGASFLSWWVLVHWIVPTVTFAPFISKMAYDSTERDHNYRVKIANTGSRDIVDAYFVIFLRIKGLRSKSSWTSFRIALDWNGESSITVPVLRAGKNRIFRLHLEVGREFQESRYLPPEIRDKARRGVLSLDDLLAFPQSHLRAYFGGADALSGARKIFQSKDYSSEEVINAPFRGLQPGPPPAPIQPAEGVHSGVQEQQASAAGPAPPGEAGAPSDSD